MRVESGCLCSNGAFRGAVPDTVVGCTAHSQICGRDRKAGASFWAECRGPKLACGDGARPTRTSTASDARPPSRLPFRGPKKWGRAQAINEASMSSSHG
jgi:hypothetical protein